MKLTVINIIHDLNHAIRISNKIVMLKDSNLINYSSIDEALDEQKLKEVFDIELTLFKNKNLSNTFVTFKKIGESDDR